MTPLAKARALLRGAQRLAAFTGAGISAESGIPTFRGAGGLWRDYNPQDLATRDAFDRDPKLVWEWYDWRRQIIAKAQPNAGHHALVELEASIPAFTVITQNVDGLHGRAGNRRILKLHGDIWDVRCTGCGRQTTDTRTPLPELPPRCRCGALLRPGVVWFGEPLPSNIWNEAEHAARNAGVFLIVGTSAVVYPAAGLINLARRGGAKCIEINPDPTPYSDLIDCSIRGTAAEVLPQLAGVNPD